MCFFILVSMFLSFLRNVCLKIIRIEGKRTKNFESLHLLVKRKTKKPVTEKQKYVANLFFDLSKNFNNNHSFIFQTRFCLHTG